MEGTGLKNTPPLPRNKFLVLTTPLRTCETQRSVVCGSAAAEDSCSPEAARQKQVPVDVRRSTGTLLLDDARLRPGRQ